MRRVVITGLGVVAPNGIGKDAFWSACANGKSGVGPIRSFDASRPPGQDRRRGARLRRRRPFVPAEHRKSLKIMSRAARFAVGAAGLAVQRQRPRLRLARTPSASASSWAPASCRSTCPRSPRCWPRPATRTASCRPTASASTAPRRCSRCGS